ncbi:AUXILIN-LIKE1 [Hibiscus trionum]|uniref:AUXILIN-LIKE1 n=1 Tax=Hibiscus trionum TaxID=183268 RepID=A0A9W7LLJ7_HIBTR|nr:AUXILIN-LIKE1 [Hibiscus trionum]
MDDFPDLLAKDFGIKPQGKSAPMAPPKSSSSGSNYGFGSDFTRSSYGNAKSTSNSIFDDQDRDGILFNDAYGGQRKYSSESRAASAQTSSFDYDSFFKDTKPPVFDKPVYDDDLFDGLPGIKSSSAKSSANYDDVFEVSGSPRKHKSMNSFPFDDLLGNLGRKETEVKANSERVRAEKDAPLFDDLLAGFGQSSSAASERSTSEAGQSQRPASNSSKTASNLMEDPFGVFEATHDPADSSTGLFTDPSEVMSKPNGFGKSKVENSSGTGGIFDDIDPLDGFGQSVPPVSSEINKRGKDRNPLRTASGPQAPATKEQNDRDHENGTKKRMPSMDGFLYSNQPVFDMPSMSTDFHSSVGRTTSPPPYSNVGSNETSSQVHTSPRSEENFDAADDVWLTVSEVPLFTQPTSAPPPSRPPPPRPPRVPKTTTGSFSSKNAKKKVDDFSTSQNSTQHAQSSQSVRAEASIPVTSQIDELEDFAMGRAWNNVDRAEVFPGDGFETNSAAAASAAAMKEAMDRAEAKFRHAKEMRERENLKAARTKEAGQMDKDERATQDALDREVREKKERLEHERQQREREEEEREKMRREMEREEKEREQKRLEKERERVRELERGRARQAVERATREARERAAVEARARAERASVEKATAEARERAERAAVQRAQAEARERAAAEAKERAERAAAEAREREAREREAQERNAAAKAEADAKHRAERAAVERAAAEARDRAAAEARERAAASARASQQYNDNDLESFFSMGSRPSSAPRPRANASDPLSDGQNKGGPEVTRRTSFGSSSSMKKASSTANIVDDLTSLFGAAASSSGEFQEVEGETEERRRARLERHQRTQERAAKALAEKNQRDLQVQREQAERHRIAETLDVEIKRWSAGKEGNLRALLSTLQYVLWPECGWQPVSLTDLITAAAVKKAYRKATLCIHPDKVQQKGANLQQKYVSEKVFDLLKEAWNKFNSEELF